NIPNPNIRVIASTKVTISGLTPLQRKSVNTTTFHKRKFTATSHPAMQLYTFIISFAPTPPQFLS
ncbi:hypothetical protein, partial [Neobacillus citreus]